MLPVHSGCVQAVMKPPVSCACRRYCQRETVLKSYPIAVRVPHLHMHASHVAESDSKTRETAAMARQAGPIVALHETFNRVSPVVLATAAN
jgi:hypothetical protein